jgi:hypothetical protein
MKIELQAFVTGSGDLSSAWQIEFMDRQEQIETHQCWKHAEDLSSQETTISITVEVFKVTFRTNAGAIAPESVGQLSTPEDKFYQVNVAKVSPLDGFDEIEGIARRTLDYGIQNT